MLQLLSLVEDLVSRGRAFPAISLFLAAWFLPEEVSSWNATQRTHWELLHGALQSFGACSIPCSAKESLRSPLREGEGEGRRLKAFEKRRAFHWSLKASQVKREASKGT